MSVLQQEIKGIFKLSFADFEFKVIKIIVFDLFGNALVIIEHPTEQEEINLSVKNLQKLNLDFPPVLPDHHAFR